MARPPGRPGRGSALGRTAGDPARPGTDHWIQIFGRPPRPAKGDKVRARRRRERQR